MKAMMWAKVKILAAVLAATAMVGAGAPLAMRALSGEAPLPAAKAADSEGAQPILEAKSYWRFFGVRGPGVIPLDLLKAADPAATTPKPFGGGDVETPPPPAGWAAPDFDDSAWLHAAGPFPGGGQGHADIWHLNWRRLMCVRGRFAVADPAAVSKLTLTMKYAGGVVVHLNGKEVFRQDMPAGELKPETPAEPYPVEAYVDSQGKIIPFGHGALGRIKAGEKDLADRIAMRAAREVKPIALPVKGLLKGANVLAVEVHEAAYRPEALQFYPKSGYPAHWPHIGFDALRLAVDAAPGAVEPNLDRPKGFRVWNQDMHVYFDDSERADPNEQVAPIRLVGAANGCYSGSVVAGSDVPIEGLKAVMSDLKGPGTIPAAAVRVRYPQLSSLGRGGGAPAFLGLEENPPAKVEPGPKKGIVQPVWITVQVPKDAPAGKYAGTLEVSAAGAAAVKVPVDLEVVGWTVPEATGFRVFGAFYQSPDSVALQYDVPMWSEEHWKRLEKSAELLGHLGNNFVCVPLVCRTEFGNDESMVTWKKKADGPSTSSGQAAYEYDFTVFDRYLDLMAKYCKVKIVSCQVYFGGGWGAVDASKRAVSVTMLDPAGKREMVEMAHYGTEEARKRWKPLMDALQERLKKKGLEGALVFGIGHCGGIHKDVIAFFKEIAPGINWHIAKHNRARPNEFPTHRYVEWMYIPDELPVPSKLPRFPNDGKGLISIMMQRITDSSQRPLSMRTAAERSYLLGDSGVGRILLDYWPVKGRVTGNCSTDGSLYSRWPEASAAQRGPHFHYLSSPGKHGAVSTPRIEALREGFQETEARLFLEDALAANKVSGELAGRCKKCLDSRAMLCRITHSGVDDLVAAVNWQERSAELYHLTAEVAAKINSK